MRCLLRSVPGPSLLIALRYLGGEERDKSGLRICGFLSLIISKGFTQKLDSLLKLEQRDNGVFIFCLFSLFCFNILLHII